MRSDRAKRGPAVKRTRKHVVFRMTPAQARAFCIIMAGKKPDVRNYNKLMELAYEGAKAADHEPDPQPYKTSRKK